jgi:hypothetical protein
MPTRAFIAKRGESWAAIERGAASMAGTRAGAMKPEALASAVSDYLATDDGKAAYRAYLQETENITENEARRRRDGGR